MADLIDIEMAATMPWTVAEDGSVWIASGAYPDGGYFRDCLLRCVPSWMHGTEGRLFEVLTYGGTKFIGPGAIRRAREVLMVWADDPLTAVDPDEQHAIERAARDQGVA